MFRFFVVPTFFLVDVVIFLLSVVVFCVEDSVIFSVFLSVVAFFSCVVAVSVVTSSVAVCVVPCVVTFSFCISFVKCCFFLPAFIFFNTIESPKKTNTMQKSRIIINPAFFMLILNFFDFFFFSCFLISETILLFCSTIHSSSILVFSVSKIVF